MSRVTCLHAKSDQTSTRITHFDTDLGESLQLAVGVAHGGDYDRSKESRAVLAHSERLLAVAALNAGQVQFPHSVGCVLWRIEHGEVPAHNFLGGVLLQALGALVPRRNTALGGEISRNALKKSLSTEPAHPA
jgi:hypothetical protein